jgi:peptidoglycan/xylan/chitin deacetylase (PgdA/CDA1 family)
VKISDMSVEDACSQVEKTSALVREITGHDTEFVRPPFGAWKTGMECSFVMIPVLWDVDPLDWTTSDTSLVVQRVVSETEDQDIILLHDCYESSVQAALQIVDQLQAEGYEFVTVDRLLLD